MANIFSNFLNEVTQGDTIKDWDHASRLYVANNYELAPKSSFLFHVFFDVNPSAQKLNGMADTGKQKELGMLVKSVQLPKFSVDMSVLNAYNRPHVMQKSMKHSPVSITFYDDSANVVRNFWFDYYSYYYRNSDHAQTSDISPYNHIHTEVIHDRKLKDWGYSVRGTTTGQNVSAQYLNSIRIFSLHNKKFSEYVLTNPLIKDFSHGQHQNSSSEAMEHTMTVEYETVLYAYGRVSPQNVDGFADLHYDKRPSPLTPAGGGSQSILGPGGIVESAQEIAHDLETGNIGAALFKGARVANGLKGANLGSMAAMAAGSLAGGILGSLGGTGQTNPFGSIAVPNIGSMMTSLGGVASGVVKGNNLGTVVTGAEGITESAATAGGVASLASKIFNTPSGIGTLVKETLGKIDGGIRVAGAKLNPNGFPDPNLPKGDLEA